MLSGADLRRYRQKLDLSQQRMVKALGVSQATLSQIESGKLAISPSLMAKLAKEYNKPAYRVKLDDYVRTVEEERRSGRTLVGNPDVTFQLLPVWEWEEGFELSATPSTLRQRGVVAVRTFPEGAIAFEMPRGSAQWADGEILVFAGWPARQCRTGDLCLVQMRTPRTDVLRSVMVTIRRDESRHPPRLQFEPVDRAQPTFTPDPEQLEGLLKCVYRARYLT